MSGNLKELRKKIFDLQEIKKITFAMKLVAASKLKNSRLKAEGAGQYRKIFQEILAKVYCAGGKDPLLQQSTRSDLPLKKLPHAMLLLSSDQGLCGGYNTSLFRAVSQLMEENTNGVIFYPMGKKGIDFCKNSRWSLNERFTFSKKLKEFDIAERIAMQFRKEFLTKAVGTVTVAYNQFESTVKQVPVFHQVLPIQVESPDDFQKDVQQFLLLEPSIKEMLPGLVWDFLIHDIFYTIVHAKASENAARMVAMDNATNNVIQMLDKTVLRKNQMRQESITAEINEIVAGSESAQN